MPATPKVSLIGAPTDIGAGDRGAVMGPEALRVAGLADALRQHGVVHAVVPGHHFAEVAVAVLRR